MGNYQNLRAWQLAMDLSVKSRPFIKRLPSEERFALADQWRRAAYSVPLNIAEGASLKGVLEFRRHLDIARGSLHEIAVILELAVRNGYFTNKELEELHQLRSECARCVWGLLRSIRRRCG